MDAIRTPAALATAVLTLMLAAAAPVVAAPAGSSDRSFGRAGVAAPAGPAGTDPSALLQAGGRIVTVGQTGQGTIVLSALTADGRPVRGYGSRVRVSAYGPVVAAATADGQVIVAFVRFARGGTSERLALERFDSSGRPDPTFAKATGALLPRGLATGSPLALTVAPDGTVLLAAEEALPGGVGPIMLVHVAPDGHELGIGQLPIARVSEQEPLQTLAAILPLADGHVLLVGTGDHGFIARFDAGGALDTAYGHDGVAVVEPADADIEDAILQDPRHLLVAGGRLLTFSRSGPLPANPLLERLNLDGTTDHSFFTVGRAQSVDTFLTAVRLDGSSIVAATTDGDIARFSADGRPDLAFGAAGRSVETPRGFSALDAPAPFGGGLAISDGRALALGEIPAGRRSWLAVSAIKLSGTGIPGPLAHRRVSVSAEGGPVAVRAPFAAADQPLTQPIAAPLLPRSIGDDPEEGIGRPAPAIVDATRGAVHVVAAGATAGVRGARFALRRSRRVASLDLVSGRCPRRATFALDGAFEIRAGRLIVTNRTRRARLVLTPCDRRTPARAITGRIHVQRRLR